MSTLQLKLFCIIQAAIMLSVILYVCIPAIIEEINESNQKLIDSGNYTILPSNI